MNIVLLTDTNGETVDARYYCSDVCAQHDPDYDGWYGCVEVEHDTKCEHCDELMEGVAK